MRYTSLELSRKLFELSGWGNNAGTAPDDRVDVWQRSYHTSSMGQGHPDYHTTAPEERNKVVVGDWHVTDDSRFHIGIPEVVFEWWWHDVQKIKEASFPAYDAGYLLRKLNLPKSSVLAGPRPRTSKRYSASFIPDDLGKYDIETMHQRGDTPEDALAKLAISLFKIGILKPNNDDYVRRTTKTTRSEDAQDALAYGLLQRRGKTKKTGSQND